MFDNVGEDILSVMPAAIDFIDVAKHYGSVLVHCNKVRYYRPKGHFIVSFFY